jgi:DNA-binding response OmpR family regulator
MKAKILIVDDDLDLVEMLRLVLTETGYATRTAVTGAEALKKARRTPPDLVLLDLILPDLNGLNVCTALRMDPVTATIPIIMMTAVPGEIPRFAGIETGADAYLNKPFSIDGLVALVNDLLHITHSSPTAFESAQTLAASVSLPHASNRPGIRVG